MASLKKRGDSYYLQFYLPGKKQQRINLHTDSQQIAKEKLRKFESAKARGNDSPLPTRTSIPQVLEAYVQYIRNAKTAKSAQTDIYYLRSLFGPVTDALKVTSRKLSAKVKKRPPKPGQDQRRKARVIEAGCFEQITTAQLAAFISGQMASRGLAPKTANRFRDTASALFSWAMTQHGVRMPEDKNPAAGVKKLKETAPEISFLTLLYVIAAWAIVTGVMQIVAAVRLRRHVKGEWMLVLVGLLSIAFGVSAMIFPGAGALAIILWIGAYSFAMGIFLIALGVRLRSLVRRIEGDPAHPGGRLAHGH